MGQQLADNPFEGLDILAVAAGLAAAFQGDEPKSLMSKLVLRFR